MKFGAITDKGQQRSKNEDNYCMASVPGMPFALFAVADGVGGYKAGEVASEIAAEVLAKEYETAAGNGEAPEPVEFLRITAQTANEEIIKHAAEMNYTDMGTTLVACAVTDTQIITINFGDSRAYLLSGGELRQFTVDHTIFAEFVRSGKITSDEAKRLYGSNRITNGLGFFACPTGDIFVDGREGADVLMLCSDGLSGMLSFEEIREHLMADGQPWEIARNMVDDANTRGSNDNITAVVVRLN